VRSSCWPQPEVIDRYFLAHTSPLKVVLPVWGHAAGPPLLLTASTNGLQIALWRFDDATMLSMGAASALLALLSETAAAQASQACDDAAASSSSSTTATTLQTACSCAPSTAITGGHLIALGFADQPSIFFVVARASADDGDALTPLPDLSIRVTQPPLELRSTASRLLCLSTDGVDIFATAETGYARVPVSRLAMSALPTPPSAVAGRDGVGGGDDDDDDDDD